MGRKQYKQKILKGTLLYALTVFLLPIVILSLLLMRINQQGVNRLWYSLSYQEIMSGQVGTLLPQRVFSNQDLMKYEMKSILPIAIPLLLLGLILLLVCTIMFFKYLKDQQAKEYQDIADSIRTMNNPDLDQEHDLVQSYQVIRESIDANLNDYKQLHSYLSHEQKNNLALLKAQSERQGQDDVVRQLDELTDGLNDILTLSESFDDQSLYKVDAIMVVAEVCDQYRKMYPQLIFDVPEDEQFEILAKTRWIYRALSNLIDNAIKYGQDKPVRLSVRVEKGSVIFKVQDLGIGIDPLRLDEIFQFQYRIHALKQDGFGIGLSLVTHVADLCGGFIDVDSNVGEGTTFYLSFPQA